MQQHITRSFLDKLRDANSRVADVIYRDTEQKNFGVRVSPGAISFFVQRKMGGSVSVKRTLGTYPEMTVEAARKRALIWLGLMADGIDPFLRIREQQAATLSAQQKGRLTFEKVFNDYAAIKKESSAHNTVKDRLKTAARLEDTKLWTSSFEDITVDLVEGTLAKLMQTHRATGWRVYRYCRAAYAYQAEKQGISGNPFSLWRKAKSPKPVRVRETILPTAEVAGQKWVVELIRLRTHPQFAVSVTADYLLCLLLWGGRKTETQRLKIAEVDFTNNVVVFKGENTKNKRAHIFPLTPWAADIVKNRIARNGEREGDWVFPSRIVGKHVVDIRNVLGMLEAASGLKICAHDLRRTFASELSGDTGSNLFMVKTAMNHTSMSQDVTVGYIGTKAKVDALRPIYEMREKRLMQFAGLAPVEVELSPAIQTVMESAARNPAVRAQLLALLALSAAPA